MGEGRKERWREKTDMNDIFRPYAIFATIGLSERKVKRRLRTA